MTRKQSVSVSHSAAFSANVSLPCLRLPDTNPEGEKAVYLCCCVEGQHANVVSNDEYTIFRNGKLGRADCQKPFSLFYLFFSDDWFIEDAIATGNSMEGSAITSVITKEA